MRIKWLHLSDIHFNFKNFDSHSLREDFLDRINNLSQTEPFTHLFLTGDILFQNNQADTETVEFIKGLIDTMHLPLENVILVPGNHDKDWNNKLVQGTFIVEQPITVLKIDGRKYVLSHFPMADWQSMSHESIHLHGHIHSEGSLYNEMNRMQGLYRYDVGVDANGYSPVSMEEILAWFDGVECRGRVKWKDWVDETGDKRVRRKLAGL